MGFVYRLNIMNRMIATAAGGLGFAALTLASLPAAADTPDETSQAATALSSDDSGISERKRRREARRHEREEANSDQSDESAAAGEAEASPYVVYVEPEMECKRVTVVGSRLPKEVCTPVYQEEVNEQSQEQAAQEFLRRTRELQTRTPPASSPYITTGLQTSP
jgi:hypothetical protein